jgi:hypothetical protein
VLQMDSLENRQHVLCLQMFAQGRASITTVTVQSFGLLQGARGYQAYPIDLFSFAPSP